jgi:acylglycerol lipase
MGLAIRGGGRPWDIGTGVAGYHWPAPTPRAALLLQHGLSEYAERYVNEYHALIPSLQALGVSVYAIDLPGHGRSPGRRVDTDTPHGVWHHRAARTALAGVELPLFLFGHSLGGLVSATSVLESPRGVRGVILSSAALTIDVPAWQRWLLPRVASVCPRCPVGRLDPGGISRDPARVQAMLDDPMKYHGRVRARMAASILATGAANGPRYASWTIPVLALHGTADRYTSCEGSRRFIERVAATDKTLWLVDGGYHELLNDRGAPAALAQVLGWIAARI